MKVDVAFIGSCTNSRLSDLREAARIVKRPPRRAARQGAGRAGLGVGCQGGRERRARRGLPRGRLRVARRGLLDVPGHEPRQARRQPGVRVVVEPQLQGPPGQSDRPHAADEPGDGGRRGGRGRSDRRAGAPADAAASRRSPGARCRCAATTSTPIASCRRGSCAASPSTGLEQHVFEDERKSARRPLQPRIRSTCRTSRARRSCSSTRNFGCGSSREHAPQALHRWGIQAVVGESFAEIFFGNSGDDRHAVRHRRARRRRGADGPRRARAGHGVRRRSRRRAPAGPERLSLADRAAAEDARGVHHRRVGHDRHAARPLRRGARDGAAVCRTRLRFRRGRLQAARVG